ncbi:MAG: hypothetical protein H0U70_00325 [Tatlockia sp.]|nr:hypothetical protein [Tatlockia sp.]
MKNLQEAINVFNQNIINYQLDCQYNNELLSDASAFFLNLNPWGKKYGGETGYHRSQIFLTKMEDEINNGSIHNTEKLLDFVINYRDKGTKLRSEIWKCIRECAGFTMEHINYFIPEYQDYYSRDVTTGIYNMGEEVKPSIDEALSMINNAIMGCYSFKLFACLNTFLGFDVKPRAEYTINKDYGHSLLISLDKKMHEVESKINLEELTLLKI